VIAFDLDWAHSPQDLQQALNKHLSSDVVACDVKRVKPGFHPRYDASWRRYNYRIYCQPVRQPLVEPYAWRVWPGADFGILHEAARLLVGTHDFYAFGTPSHSGGNTTRRVLESGWKQEAPYLVYEIKAHAFLYHMVRRLVFMQVSIAQAKLDITDLMAALEPSSGDHAEKDPGKRMVHGLAPAQGLVLAEVHYPPGVVGLDEDDQELEKSVDRQLDASR
jgi:tRNA pseudouridine38-40 synthase